MGDTPTMAMACAGKCRRPPAILRHSRLSELVQRVSSAVCRCRQAKVEERGGCGAGWPCDKDEKRLGSRLARPDNDFPPKLYSMTGLGGGVGSSEGVEVMLSTRLHMSMYNKFCIKCHCQEIRLQLSMLVPFTLANCTNIIQ